jgi:hypothetical protein
MLEQSHGRWFDLHDVGTDHPALINIHASDLKSIWRLQPKVGLGPCDSGPSFGRVPSPGHTRS